MKAVSFTSVIFSTRTFAAAMLALYLSYQLDLARPTWAFITTYIVSTPLRGAGRSKGLYRICGTLCGAIFTVAAIPNLVNAPELLVLALAIWIGGCLYLSILDGTPRSYALMLAGYTTALIGFPSVNAPQTIFDTAIARTEEIGVAILCAELMSYLPFGQRAGDALHIKMENYLLEMRKLAVSLMTFNPHTISITERAKLMIDVASMNALRIQAHYDTPYFPAIEGWFVQLQRHLRDFFADLVTFEAQLQKAQADGIPIEAALHPITDAILAWIESAEIAIPQKLRDIMDYTANDPSYLEFIKRGIHGTLSGIIARRGECLALRQKILAREKVDQPYRVVAHYVDYRQAAFYGIAVALQLIIGCSFWIATGWPEGSIMVMISTVICCFFASLEAPPTIVLLFLAGSIIGSFIGWGYNFVIFPHIEGFVPLVFVLAFSCIPIGLGMANPSLAGLMLPIIIGINIADFQNRFEANIVSFLNGFIAQTMGVLTAGIALGFIRAITLENATKHLLTENGQSLASLADNPMIIYDHVFDRMTHRSALALIRAPRLQRNREKVATRVLLDLQIGRALVQIKDLLPEIPDPLQQTIYTIHTKLAFHFSSRHGLEDPSDLLRVDIRELKETLDQEAYTFESLKLIGLIETLDRGIGEEPA